MAEPSLETGGRRSLGLRQKLARIAFGTFLALVALEITLQIGALVIRSMNADDQGAGQGGVLCIGDSFTFGFGAEDPENSYPRELDRRLETAGLAVEVVNSGWPGRDSAATLRLIPDQLTEYNPRVVYLLVGYNDFWSGQPDEPGFFGRLRTVRLGRMIWAWATGSIEEDSPASATVPAQEEEGFTDRATAPFLGPWHAESLRLIFRADSSVHTLTENLPFLWNWAGNQIQLRNRETDETVDVTFSVDGDTLTLSGGPFGPGTEWQRGLGEGDALERSNRLREQGEEAKADRLLIEALAVPGPRGDEAWRTWVDLRVERSDLQALTEQIPTLVRRFDRDDPTTAAGRALLGALIGIGNTDRLDEVLSRFVRTQAAGSCESLLLHLQDRHPELIDDLQSAVSANLRDKSLGLPRLMEIWALHVLFEPEDGTRHAGAIVAALRFDIDNQKVRRNMTRNRRCSREEFAAEVERQERDPKRRDRMLAAFDDATSGKDSTREVLWSNLNSILELCRQAGADVVLLNYPNGRPELDAIYREFAAANDLTAIDVYSEFRRRVDADRLAELFIFDGHCNDEGYRLMGQIVAEDAVQRLR
ncbi:MAG: SGNH/GDSL hydrolase family protein [Planctomycetota bacterium]